MSYLHALKENIWDILRIFLGFVYVWAFIDKTYGLGFATLAEDAWIAGGSPTFGYLTYGTKGPLASFFQSLSENGLVEWLFMLGVLFVGVTLLSGIMIRIGALVGMLFYVLFYISGFIPPEHNPVIDEHVINFILMFGIFMQLSQNKWSLHTKWKELSVVKKYPILQ